MENTSGELAAYNLSSSGTPTEVSGKILNGRQYASGSYDIMAHTSAVPAGTISQWFNFSSINVVGRLFNKTHSGVTDAFLTHVDSSNKFQVYIHDLGSFNANATVLSTSTWYHYVVTWDGANVIVYKNGSVETTQANSASLQAEATNFAIGGTPVNSQYINGIVDEVGFWNRALTSTEVTALYNSGAGFQYPFSVAGTPGYRFFF